MNDESATRDGLAEMKARLAALVAETRAQVAGADQAALRDLRLRVLGKKGELTAILRGMGALPAEERPVLGAAANAARDEIESLLADAERRLAAEALNARLAAETIDVTLPGRPVAHGHKHPLLLTLEEIERIFVNMGFIVAEGPEVETDYYNFQALNIPKDHPARDMQDSFYFSEEICLRSQTSPVQIRTMQRMAPELPVRIIAPGTVYRRDDDATHSPMFTQVEMLVVDKGITMGDLKGTLLTFAREFFGPDAGIRLRPSYFPFTEPSAEVDVTCAICHGAGCRVCKGTGWLEILGAGMVHPNVLREGGYDPEEVTGFAFGLGIERAAMLKYGIEDMRHLFTNDMRFLRQF